MKDVFTVLTLFMFATILSGLVAIGDYILGIDQSIIFRHLAVINGFFSAFILFATIMLLNKTSKKDGVARV